MNEQEKFWKGKFGDLYIERNKDEKILTSNIKFFSVALKSCENFDSVLEFGPNIGLNLMALNHLFPNLKLNGVEINKKAYEILKSNNFINAFNNSIEDFVIQNTYDLTFTKGVLIHINPEQLSIVYEKLYLASNKYILITEYYSDHPEEITYRGNRNKLFKRDFAGEFLKKFSDVQLKDYGFIYKGDENFFSDSVNWFLLEKKIK